MFLVSLTCDVGQGGVIDDVVTLSAIRLKVGDGCWRHSFSIGLPHRSSNHAAIQQISGTGQ